MKPTTLLLALTLACAPADDTPEPEVAVPTAPTLVATIDSLATPESMLHDPEQDVYFISSINGGGGAADGNGFISRVLPDGRVEQLRFIDGARAGTTLHAPKGLALSNGLLWVTDLDHLRAFDPRTGEPRTSVHIEGAVFLNDIVTAPDGTLYVTDSRLDFSGGDSPTDDRQYRIYRVLDGAATIALADSALARPNGLAWSTDGRLIIAPLGAGHLLSWQPGTDTLATFGAGPGGYDGIVELEPGTYLVSSIDSNQVGTLTANTDFEVAVDSLTFPADIGYDRARGRVLVPRLADNRAEIWTLPGRR